MADFLIKKGDCVNGTDLSSAPIHIAARNGCFDTLKVLLENEADVNLQNNRKETALHLIARSADWFSKCLKR